MATICHFRAFASPGFDVRLDTILLERGNKRADEAIRIEAGRDLTWTDIYGGRKFVLVSENLARELFGSATDVNKAPRARMRIAPQVAGNMGCKEGKISPVQGSLITMRPSSTIPSQTRKHKLPPASRIPVPRKSAMTSP